MADIYWLRTIQYIGSNAVSGEYKKYLSVMMELITDLNPYFVAPYRIGLLLIPSDSGSNEERNNPDNRKEYRKAEKLGLKGIENFCDPHKIKRIK